MNITEITKQAGAHRRRKRLGRGTGSGLGKTCGKGHKGQKARSGGSTRKLTAGGQMPLFRQLPKRGFSNAKFAKRYNILNITDLEARFDADTKVTPELLRERGLLRNASWPVKILGDGELTKKLAVHAHKFSAKAVEKIAGAGGSTEVVGGVSN